MLYMTATEDYQLQRRVAQTNIAGNAANGTTLMAASAAGANVAEVRRHVIDTWLGFLGSAKPNFIDTSLLGNVRISITLAGTDIIGLKAAGFCWNFDLFFLFIGFLDHLQMEVVQKPLFPLCL